MSTVRLYLDLAARINEDHEARSGDTALTVVPVIVDDLERSETIARCLTALVGGAVLNAEVFDSAEPAPTHDNMQVRIAIETALSFAHPRGSRPMVIEAPSPGMYAVTYPASGGHSGGESAMVGLARALMSAELVTGELAVVLYDERGMDKYMLHGCWSLLVDQLPRLVLPPVRTLVAFVAARPSVDPHGQPKRGCVFAVADDRLQRRKAYDNAASDAAFFANARVPVRALFLGAGFSHSSRLPLGNDLRDSAMRRLLGETTNPSPASGGNELAIRFRRMLASNDELHGPLQRLNEQEFAAHVTLEQVLAFEKVRYADLPTLAEFREVHDRAVAAPGEAVAALARIVREPNDLVLVTVNFDELLESHASEYVQPFATDAEFTRAAEYIRRYRDGLERKVPLLKLHGTISVPDSCVVTTTQTEQGVSPDKRRAVEAITEGLSEPVPWVYVGVSMRDLDLRTVLGNPDFGRAVEEQWVSPFLDPNVEAFAEANRAGCWQSGRSLQARLITEVADEFMQLVEQHWPAPGADALASPAP